MIPLEVAVVVLWIALLVTFDRALGLARANRDLRQLTQSLNEEWLYERSLRQRAHVPLTARGSYATINELIGERIVDEP